jgi:hypothetical protein
MVAALKPCMHHPWNGRILHARTLAVGRGTGTQVNKNCIRQRQDAAKANSIPFCANRFGRWGENHSQSRQEVSTR